MPGALDLDTCGIPIPIKQKGDARLLNRTPNGRDGIWMHGSVLVLKIPHGVDGYSRSAREIILRPPKPCPNRPALRRGESRVAWAPLQSHRRNVVDLPKFSVYN